MKFLFFTFLSATIFAQTTPIDLPVDFEGSTVNYTMSDFGDNVSSLVTDPYASGNIAMKVIKTSGAATWAGTTIGTPAGFATNIPLSLSNSVMAVSVWSPQAGTPIRLKVEDSNDPTHTCETETNTTVSGWQVVEFDFVNQAPGTELLSVGLGNGWTYNMASIFFNFGTEGTGETYYFDDVQMCANGDCIDPCEGITCSEGQTCNNGDCVDIPVDPCEGITCDEGLTCEDGVCVNPDTGIVFSGAFGGTAVDGNTYTNPTGSEGWAGFANEDVSLYPFSFSDGGEITFTGATAGTDVDVYFRFEYNPYPDTEPSFNTAAVTVSGTAEASYSVDISAQGSNTYSSFLLYVTTLDAPVTLTNVAVASGGYIDPCADVICGDGQECVDGECVGSVQIDLPVDFESSTIDYTMSDFGDNVSSLVADPYASGNMAMKVIKTSGAATWAGTTIGTPAGFATNIPLTLSDSKLSARVWSPQAGTPIRLKVEDSNDPTHTCETETNTTVSGWQVVEFDFVNQAPGTELLSVGLGNGWTYNMASIFFNFGTEGTGETYYFDDVQMCANGDCIDPCEGITCDEGQTCEDGNCVDIPVDPCEGITCDEGQTCEDGNCVDIPVDPCEGITCDEGQTCEDGVCVNSDTGIVFSGDFGGTFYDSNTYTNPTGSEDWAGFANEDTDLYPFSFSDGGEITFTGATAGTDVDVYFRFEYNPYPDTEPSFNTAAVTVSGTAEASYSVDIPAQGSNTYSSFLLYVTTLDAPVTLTNVAVASGGYIDPCADVICGDGQECVDGECVGSVQIDLPVDFESSTIDYTMSDFGDNVSSLVADPYASGNMAMKVIKTSGAATWAGTTIGTPAGFATNIPLTLSDSKLSARVWSPQAGTPIRLKVEDSNDPTHTCETETNTTVSGWQVVEFDFVNQAPGTELLSVGLGNGWTYNMASIFFNFGTEGTGETYYFDDVQFGESTIGINNYEINELSIFPNPANSQWTIHSENTDITLVEVFDLQGKLVLTLSPDSPTVEINASNLVKGVYLSKISTDSGTSTVRLVKI